MTQQVRKASLHGFRIRFSEFVLCFAAVHLQCTDGGHQHGSVRFQAGEAALDIQELFSPQVGTEACFRYHIISQMEGCTGSQYGVAAMSNICEGTAMDKGRYLFQGLYQVRFQGILHEGSHGPLGVDITGSNRFVIIGVAYDDPGKSFLHIPNGISKAEDGHHFGSYGNIKSVFPGNPIGMSTKTYDDMAEHPVVHILHPFPDHPAGIDAQGISLLDMVVHHGSQKIVGCCNGMKVTGEMEVNIFHRNHLGIAAACSAALNTHAGAK